MQLNFSIETLEEVARQDLERCETAIQAGDKDAALTAIEQVFAKVDTVIDLLRMANDQEAGYRLRVDATP